MVSCRVEVDREHKALPGNIVEAIANEAGIESRYIGKIAIYDEYSIVDLSEGMPQEKLRHLKKVLVSGQKLDLSLVKGGMAVREEKVPIYVPGRKNVRENVPVSETFSKGGSF